MRDLAAVRPQFPKADCISPAYRGHIPFAFSQYGRKPQLPDRQLRLQERFSLVGPFASQHNDGFLREFDQTTCLTHNETLMDEITEWLEGVKRQDARSQEEIWNAYYKKLVGLARQRLRSLRDGESDEEDVAISAFNSFFRAVQEERLPKLNDRHDLWRVLIVIAARKISSKRKRVMAAKRGEGRIRGESVSANEGYSGMGGGIAQVMGTDPSPEMAAQTAEALDRLLNALRDETLQTIAIRKLEGFSNREIAEEINVVERSVERKLARIRSIWTNEQSAWH